MLERASRVPGRYSPLDASSPSSGCSASNERSAQSRETRPMRPRRTFRPATSPVIFALLVASLLVVGITREVTALAAPAGEAVVAWHVTIAPTWFDPSTAPAQITPFGILFVLHDALVRPLPNQKMGNSLAESWTESPDGLVYEFKLRRGLRFHNGDPVTTEDVKFSFERYKGTGATELKARVQQVDIVDPLIVRFLLKEP